MIDGGDQPYDAGGNKILQAHRFRQAVLNTAGNQPHLRQMFENEPFPLGFAYFFGSSISVHSSFLLKRQKLPVPPRPQAGERSIAPL